MELVYLHSHVQDLLNEKVKLQGWIKNHRKQKEYGFIDFYDGTCFQSLQLVYTNTLQNFDGIQKTWGDKWERFFTLWEKVRQGKTEFIRFWPHIKN